jgi:hypothetical protein
LNSKYLLADIYSLPDRLDVNFSTPNEVNAKRVERAAPKYWNLPMLLAASVIGIVVWQTGMLINAAFHKNSQEFTASNRNVVIAAASQVALPHFAELYFAAPEPLYYSEGDLAFSLAQESGKPAETEKYRRLISLTLRSAEGIVPESQASLYYCRGKLDLLLSDDNAALDDFRRAISMSKSTVEARAKIDESIQKYLVEHGLF